jgi:hypothetical protein
LADDIFNKIFSAASGVWALFARAAVTLFKAWPHILGRLNERNRDRVAEEASEHARFLAEVSRLDQRCDHLQNEVDECRKREGEWMSRAIAAEAVQLGLGAAKQEAQRIVSAEREANAQRGNGG